MAQGWAHANSVHDLAPVRIRTTHSHPAHRRRGAKSSWPAYAGPSIQHLPMSSYHAGPWAINPQAGIPVPAQIRSLWQAHRRACRLASCVGPPCIAVVCQNAGPVPKPPPSAPITQGSLKLHILHQLNNPQLWRKPERPNLPGPTATPWSVRSLHTSSTLSLAPHYCAPSAYLHILRYC